MQSLLHTLTSRWRLPVGKLEAGWLQPLSVDDYRAAVSTATAAESAREPPRITVPKMAPPLGPCTGGGVGQWARGRARPHGKVASLFLMGVGVRISAQRGLRFGLAVCVFAVVVIFPYCCAPFA